MNYDALRGAIKIYKENKNVTEYLKKFFKKNYNTSEIIEIAYNLQSGTYIKFAKSNINKIKLYTEEISHILDNNIVNNNSLLDVGTGELTTFTHLLNSMKKKPSKILAFDLSAARLIAGKKYFLKHIINKNTKPIFFCSDIKAIPLHSNSIDVIISNHSLEPNGKNLTNLLRELFRVGKKKLLLFEPSYELNSIKGKQRMDKLGYIKNISLSVKKLGGKLIDVIPIKNIFNKLNPTACYIIKLPIVSIKKISKNLFTIPKTDFPIKKDLEFYVNKELGIAFPIFKSIPIIKDTSRILV